MTSRDFAFWLQGFFEINGKVDAIDAEKAKMIHAHLQYVFKHEIFPEKKPDTITVTGQSTQLDWGKFKYDPSLGAVIC